MNTPYIVSLVAITAGVTGLAGCTVGPDYSPPDIPAAESWSGPAGSIEPADPGTLVRWWEQFDDPQLTSLIERAALSNKDIQQAVARIDEARALTGVAKGDRFPQVEAAASYSRQRATKNGAPEVSGTGSEFNDYSVGVDASWEIDVFGRIRRSVESAEAGWQASVEDYRAVSVALFADVAATYTEFRTLQAQVAVAERNVALQRRSLELVRERFKAELVSELDVTQARALLADTESTIPRLREALARTVNRLSVLLGEQPGALARELAGSGAIPPPPRALRTSTPADVIRQRPDIRRVERELAAQTARIGVAEAELYPRFSLVGSFAFESNDTGDLFDGASRSFRFGPAVRWNVFNGGRIRSLVDAEDARARQALHAYEQAVLAALEESENAIVAVVRERERFASLEESLTAARRSVEIADDLYRTGLSDYQRVLDAQRALVTAEDAQTVSRGQQALNVVALYRAFGGGWEHADGVLLSGAEAE